MKFKKFSLLSLLTLGSIALSSCYVDLGFIKFGTKETEYITDDKVVGTYYSGYDLTKKGGRLANELQKLCFDKHTQWIKYSQINSYFTTTTSHDSAEAIAKGSKTNQWFYTGKEQGGCGTREHVWPCANSNNLWSHDGTNTDKNYVDGTNYIGGGSDLFHVRTANSSVNTARGNSKFVDFDDPEQKDANDIYSYTEKGGKYSIKISGHSFTNAGVPQYANKCEPADEMKGDVARILLYVWVHYNERGATPEGQVKSGTLTYQYSDMTANLEFSDIMGGYSDTRAREVLIAWNKLDPPSQVEKLRNDTVQKIQGNRNPFVDHPDLVERVLKS